MTFLQATTSRKSMNTGNLRPGNGGVPPPDRRYSPTQPNHHRVQPGMPANTQSVSRTEIEHLWDSITNQTPEPHAGIFGPSSISWKVNRESALFLGAGRASLLQLAHPWVAAALDRHSNLRNDPLARFHNTFRVVFPMIFGTLSQALAASRHLYQLH